MKTRCLALLVSAKACESGAITEAMRYRKTTHLHHLLEIMAAPLLLLFVAREARGQSALEDFEPNGTVQVVVVQPNGKILIGNFTTPRRTAARPLT